MNTTDNLPSRVRQIAAAMFPLVAFAYCARADIFQWEYIDPADPSQAKCESTTLAPDGAGVDAVPGANLEGRNLTMAYLIGADLTGAYGVYANLTNADLSQADLTNANFWGTTLTDTEFTNAEVQGAFFGIGPICSQFGCSGTGITLAQLYSTASYQAHELSGISLFLNDLAGANFTGQNLADATFTLATLTGADFRQANLTNAYFYSATLTGADFTSADTRGAQYLTLTAASSANQILPDGRIDGLNLDAGGLLIVRDYDGDPRYEAAPPPIPITVDQHLSMGPGGTLRMVFEADAWDSTISFASGIPVTLGGTLELTLAADVNIASQRGRTFDLFDWTGVSPIGAFTIASPYAWNLSNLYTTGEVTLSAVPEPGALVLFGVVVSVLLPMRRIALGQRRRGLQFAAATFPLIAFASFARPITIETVPVGNPGNAPDTRYNDISVGSVGYVYQISKYEVTAGQYTEFLNAVGKDDPNGLYNEAMGDPVYWGANIQRTGSSPNYGYSVAADWAHRPVNHVSFWDGARFANWLHNGQPTGPQGPGTTEGGAYHDVGNQTLFGRNAGARFFIPTEDEWYKAAYHDQSAGLAANYYDYPTGTNAVPGNDINETTNPGNNANYYTGGYAIGSPYYRTVAGEFQLSGSPYGTFDQGGNVIEWNETAVTSRSRGLRGGSFLDDSLFGEATLHASFRYFLFDPASADDSVGFRVASIPEPSSLLLVSIGFAAILTMRRVAKHRPSRALQIAAAMLSLFAFAAGAHAEIFQWEYTNPADPSQGRRQSTTLAPDGAGVDAVPGANLEYRNLTMAYLAGQHLYGATFKGADLTSAYVAGGANLTNADLTHANLTNADFNWADLTGADFSGAEIRGARFHKDRNLVSYTPGGLTLAQIYSTASYQAHDLSGVGLAGSDLAGAMFAGQNLSYAVFNNGRNVFTNLARANLSGANLTNVIFNGYSSSLSGADLSAADVRGATDDPSLHPDVTSTNLIRPNGHINGLDLGDVGLLVVRDYDGGAPFGPNGLVSITVDQHMSMGPGGTLRMVFEADAWDSTISFAHGIPVTLGGTLELTFAADVNLASQLDRTFKVFDWTGVNPTGAFTISSPYAWDLSNLYTTGEVTLTAIPEPSSLALAATMGLVLVIARRRKCPQVAPRDPNHNIHRLRRLSKRLGTHSIRTWTASVSTVLAVGAATSVAAAPPGPSLVLLQNATATFSQEAYGGYPVSDTIDGDFSSVSHGWAVAQDNNLTNPETAVFETAEDLTTVDPIIFHLHQLHSVPIADHTLGKFRLSVTSDSREDLADGLQTNGDVTANWTVLHALSAESTDGAILNIIGDGSILVGGLNPAIATYTVTALAPFGGITGFRLETLADPSLPFDGPGRQSTNGNFVLTEFQVFAISVPEPTTLALFMLAAMALFVGRRTRLRTCLFTQRRSSTAGLLVSLSPLLLVSPFPAHADIYQWEYIDPADPSQGKRQSTTLAPDGAGVDAVPGALLSGRNLTMAYLEGADLSQARFLAANLTNASLRGSNLRKAFFSRLTPLCGLGLPGDFACHSANLTGTDLTGAEVQGANFGYTGITLEQLYSTASYQAHDLSDIWLTGRDLTSANFADIDLTRADFTAAKLTNADFSGALVQGANFSSGDRKCFQNCIHHGTGVTLSQLYSTASYQASDLSGSDYYGNDLSGGNVAGQNLTNASFTGATLTGADFTAADMRGAFGLESSDLTGAASQNLIRHDGHISGLDLSAASVLMVRDYDGNSIDSMEAIPVTIDQHFAMTPGSTLQMVFEEDAWDSTISFAPGIPVTLGGTLELAFAADVNLASQVGRTLDLFDGTGVTPTGAFAISSPYSWDLTNLYTTGEVTLTAIPEPTSHAALVLGMLFIFAPRRALVSQTCLSANRVEIESPTRAV
jgi:uncharacterized protein YjbI with pentapeptide repeats/formylglycine-generating enzyme required for sulfatase activity